MKIITDSITFEELKRMAAEMFGNSVKAVADTGRELLALDAELHNCKAMILSSSTQ